MCNSNNSSIKPITEHLIKVINILKAQFELNRVSTTHDSTFGRQLETLLVSELRKYIPNIFGIEKTAFIRTAENPLWESNEIDIIFTNNQWGSPIAVTNEYKVYPLESIIGLLEVTSNINRTKLNKDFLKVKDTLSLVKRYYNVSLPVAKSLGFTIDDSKYENISERNLRATITQSDLQPRFFYFAYSSNWVNINTIISNLENSLRTYSNVVLHGMYIIDIGFFRSKPGERTTIDYDTSSNSFITFLHVLIDALHTFTKPPMTATIPYYLYGSKIKTT
jgi:hypothetical protein